MKKDIADKWVEALRSGQFKQGRGALNRGGQLCCLGVLCEIAIAENVGVDKRANGPIITYNGQRGTLPDLVKAWAEMKSHKGKLDTVIQGSTTLTGLNDNRVTFTEIADLIEAHWEKL